MTYSILKELFNLKLVGTFDSEIKKLLNLNESSYFEEAVLSNNLRLLLIVRTKNELKDLEI